MDDLISRQAAIAYAISGRVRTLPTSEDGENWIRTEEVRQSLSTMPSAQPEITLEQAIDRLHELGWMQEHDRILTESAQERKKGKWEEICSAQYWQYTYEHYRCTNCGLPANCAFRYCPNCGADMRGEE